MSHARPMPVRAAGIDERVLTLAEQIKAAQSPEIDQMTTWLTDWDQPAPAPEAVMDDDMDHSGGRHTQVNSARNRRRRRTRDKPSSLAQIAIGNDLGNPT